MASKQEIGKSACEEMATEIARLAQHRVVEVDRVSFQCGPVTLKMVKTTAGVGWLLDGQVLFYSNQIGSPLVASAFFNTITARAEPEDHHYCIRFGETDIVVWRVHKNEEMKRPLAELASIIKTPPTLVSG